MNEILLIATLILFLVVPRQLGYRTRQMIFDFKPSKIKTLPDNLKSYIYGSVLLPTFFFVGFIVLIFISEEKNGLLIIGSPFLIVAYILIDHFLNYFQNRTIVKCSNQFHDRTIEILEQGRILKLNKATVKLAFEFSVPTQWRRLPWGKFSYIKIQMQDGTNILINDIEADIGLLSLLLSYYGVTVIKIEKFNNKIEHATTNN